MGSIALFSQSSDLTNYSNTTRSSHSSKETLKDLDKNNQENNKQFVVVSPTITLTERDPNLPATPSSLSIAAGGSSVTMTKPMQHHVPQHKNICDLKNNNIRNKPAVVETSVPDIAETSSSPSQPHQHERAPQVAKTITDLHHPNQQSVSSPSSLSPSNSTIPRDSKPKLEQQDRESADRHHDSVAVASGDVSSSRQDDQSHSAFRFPPPGVTGLGIEPMESPKRSGSSSESVSSSSAVDRKLENQSSAGQADDLHSKDTDTSILSALLGIPVDSWNFSDESLAQALRLKTEQEKTKQEYYRLETRRKSLKLLSEAIRYNVPASSIPLLFQYPEDATVQAAIASVSGSSTSPMSKRPSMAHPPSKQVPVTVPASVSDRDRYPSHSMHQRNMSLPNQMYMDPMAMAQRQPPPVPPSQQSQFKPGHHHHASSSSISSPAYSPVRQPVALYPSGRRSAAPYSYGQPPPPPPQAPSIISPSSSSNSLHHIIQFHHWQPNQSSSAQSKGQGSPSPRHEDDNQSIKRRRSLLGERTGSPPEQSGSGRSLAASAAAAVHASRRKSMHARHRSEASIPHTTSWASGLSQQSQQVQRQETIPEDSSGVNILATVAAASSDDAPEPKKDKDKRGKHNIGFVMSGS